MGRTEGLVRRSPALALGINCSIFVDPPGLVNADERCNLAVRNIDISISLSAAQETSGCERPSQNQNAAANPTCSKNVSVLRARSTQAIVQNGYTMTMAAIANNASAMAAPPASPPAMNRAEPTRCARIVK